VSETDWVPRTLRSFAIAMMALCIVGLPLACFPSADIYRDAGDCVGRIFAAHGGAECTTTWVHAETLYPGLPVMACLVAIGLGVLALHRKPTGWAAVLGALPVCALAVIGAARAVDFQIFTFDRHETRWSGELLGMLFGVIAVTAAVVFVSAPFVAAARARERRRAARPDPIPTARVVRRD
jgi:hypothetical protein